MAGTVRNVDLHTHTIHSDGEFTTEALLKRAVQYDLAAIAITDHDTVAAYVEDREVIERFAQSGELEIVPGIELSTADETGNKRHILGLNIDPLHPALTEVLEDIQLSRLRYTSDTCNLLELHGWNIDQEALLSTSGTITKAHIARALLSDPRNREQWTRWTGSATPTEGQLIEATIGRGKPLYIEKEDEISPRRAAQIIHLVGGVAILAHPSFNLMKGESIKDLPAKLLSWGVDGIEAIYMQYDRSNNDRESDYCQQLTEMALRNGLLVSGGSDFHTDDEHRMGKYIDVGFHNHQWKVPEGILRKIKDRSTRQR